MKFKYAIGATPLDEDQLGGLIPSHITTQNELNEWEAQNILEAEKWLIFSKKKVNILTSSFIKELHKQMFSKTWKWAGEFRTRQTNIGIEGNRIYLELLNLLDTINYWDKNKIYSYDEIAVRLHHKLVYIHCFPNGNGRHARMVTDLYLESKSEAPFTWGAKNLTTDSNARSLYIRALRAADHHDYSLILEFVRN
jgi:Fic-DOC domain mobile mystery protein B